MAPRDKLTGDVTLVALDWAAAREAEGVEVERVARWDPWALPWGRGGESWACVIAGPSMVFDAGSGVLFRTLDRERERERERERAETEAPERTEVVVTEPAVLVVRFQTRRRWMSPAVSESAPTRLLRIGHARLDCPGTEIEGS